jgi:integrase
MKLVLYTGMRRGELFRLRWDDVDFDRGFIHIRGPKGGRDQKIPMNSSARELLKKHPKTKHDSPYVFPGKGGKQRTDIKKAVNKIRDDAGLPSDFRALHGLRHVYASMLASSGQVDMYTLQKLLTHKSPLMTQRYAHLRDETLKKASDLAGDLIGEATKSSENEDENEDKEGEGGENSDQEEEGGAGQSPSSEDIAKISLL